MFLLVNTLGRTSVVLNINRQILVFILRGSLTLSILRSRHHFSLLPVVHFLSLLTLRTFYVIKHDTCNWCIFSFFLSPYCFKIYWYQKAKFLLIMLENERDNCIKNCKNLCQLLSSNSWISFMSDASAAILSSCKKSKETAVSCY